MVKFRMIVLCVLIALPLFIFNLNAQEKKSSHVRYAVDENGNKMVMRQISGKPPKDPSLSPFKPHVPKDTKTVNYLNLVPCYDWSYGCTATASSMWAGYYDNFGSNNVYIGPENGGLQPMSNATWNTQASQTGTSQDPVAATKIGVDGRIGRGHGDDYWVQPDSESDPYFGNWLEHDYNDGQRCTGDFMGTNQFNSWENIDGSTALWAYMAPSGGKLYDKGDEISPPSRDGIHGIRLFFESLGYEVTTNWTQLVDGWVDPEDEAAGPVEGGYTFADFKASIDAGRPVMIGLDNHSIVGYGYDDSTTPPTVYIRSTWYNTKYAAGSETMLWGTDFSGLYHYCMSEIILAPSAYYGAPDDLFGLNNNRVVTLTWSDPSENTRNLTYDIYRDGLFLINTATEGYVDNTAPDGLHRYKIKAKYTDPEPDVTSFFSNETAVFVSISVTEFHDDFESGIGQWIPYQTWGLDAEGTDDGVYAGAAALADSPAGNYPNNAEAYGGSPCEIAPGLNFSTAADASMDFYLKYDIEMGFDYLRLQTCKDGINWVTMKEWTGGYNGGDYPAINWYKETISLGVFAGESNVRIRFAIFSDTGLEYTGANIDNVNITPSLVDTTPPFVFYTKERDYFNNESLYDQGGFTIITDITDFSGINHAEVEYKVDGGSVVPLAPHSVNDDEYTFIIPTQPVGSLVEFRFDCTDTSPAANQSFSNWHFFRSGKHQKYDNSFVSYIVSIASNPADNVDDYVAAIGVKFTSFHDDLAGVVVRGYTDGDQPPNATMLIDVLQDDGNGLPGVSILPSGPVSFTNPATLTDTNAWGYVDLSSYNLDDLVGDYYISISADTDNDYTISCYTECDESASYKYGMTRWKGYIMGGESAPTWYDMPNLNHHTRAVMTDYGITPGIIDPETSLLTKTVAVGGTGSDVLTIGNAGSYAYNYTAVIDYDGYIAGGTVVVEENYFATTLGDYTNTGADINWAVVSGAAKVVPPGNGSGLRQGQLTSGTFVGSGCVDPLTFSFTQNFVDATTSGVSVEYLVGSTWTSIYSSAVSTTAPQSLSLPNTATRIRFTANLMAKSSAAWTVDNVVISGTEMTPYSWLTLDGGASTSGSVTDTGTDDIAIGYIAGTLPEGDYFADILLESEDSEAQVAVAFTVGSATVVPDVPANITTTLVLGNVLINWDDAANATGYQVYSSLTPYGTFTLIDPDSNPLTPTVTLSDYTYTPTESKKFFQIKSWNNTKVSPVTLEVVKAVKKQTRPVIQKKIGN